MNMECQDMETLLVDYLDGNLSPAIRSSVSKHLEGCASCRQELEEYRTLFSRIDETVPQKPSPLLREKFDIMLQSELNIDATSRIIKKDGTAKVLPMKNYSILLRIAASVILVTLGVFIGARVAPAVKQQPSAPSEIADLKNEVREMKETLMFNLLNDESASERIKAVNYVDEMGGNTNQKIINALFHTLNTDKNLNVRLAALYSVERFTTSQSVRDSLVASLPKQTEPIIQIVLINILTEKKETKAIGPIRDILLDKRTMKPVKEIAAKGLQLL